MKRDLKHRNRSKKRTIFTLFVVALLLMLFIWIDMSIRPAIENIIEYQAKVFAMRLINESMISQMDESGMNYDDFIQVTRSEDGNVTSIETDMLQINRLKAKIGESVINNLESRQKNTIAVPIGTVIGNEFTSGRGPLVEIKIFPTGYVQTEIFNKFSDAGINQTLHQVMLQVTVQMVAVLPGYSVKTEATTNFCIADTVIVGKIPQGYASIGQGAATFLPVKNEALK